MIEVRPGLTVRYHPAQAPDDWRLGILVKPSPNGEEWLVKGAFGKFWLAVGRLFPIEKPPVTGMEGAAGGRSR